MENKHPSCNRACSVFFVGGGGGSHGPSITPFFSRRIGLFAGRTVPIVGGARLTGKVGRQDVGVLSVRMALHSGAAELRAGDYTSGEYLSGLTLSRTARLLSAGHGGQILLSQTTRDLLAYELPEGIDLQDLGEHLLKDLAQPEHVISRFVQLTCRLIFHRYAHWIAGAPTCQLSSPR